MRDAGREVQGDSPSAGTVPVQPQASSPQSPVLADAGSLQEALQITRQSMQALQNLQEQTSRLHQQFLSGQEAATHSFLHLVEQQNRLMQGQPLNPVAASAVQSPLSRPPFQRSHRFSLRLRPLRLHQRLSRLRLPQ